MTARPLQWGLTPYDAILFDFDGVLIDSEPIHYECWREVLAPQGVNFDWDVYVRNCIGVADRKMMDFLATLATPPADPEALFSLYPAKQKLYQARVAAAPPFPVEVRRLLDTLDGYPLAVVSSSHRPEVEPLLVNGGLRDRFRAVVCGDDVERHKPAPDPYLLAARQLGVFRPLVVEDSAAGMASARAAGFDAVRVTGPLDVPAAVSGRLALSAH